jgi:hypothetical protein
MTQEKPAGTPAPGTSSPPAEAELAQFTTRRLMFMSRGLMMALTGGFLCAMACFGCVVTAFPNIRAYALPLGLLAGIGLALLNLGIERTRARSTCHVRTVRKATLRENLGLTGAILSGIVILVLLDERLPEAFNRDWAWLALLALMGLGFGGYLLYQAKRVRLFEMALVGAGMLALVGVGLCAHFLSLREEAISKLLTGLEAGFGLLLVFVGVSLHRRWITWRAQALGEAQEGQT